VDKMEMRATLFRSVVSEIELSITAGVRLPFILAVRRVLFRH